MFELLRKLIQPTMRITTWDLLEDRLESKHRMQRFADFWYYLGWIMYYEQAFVDLRNKWERQAYEPKSMYDVVRTYLRRK